MQVVRKLFSAILFLLTPSATLVPVREDDARRRLASRGVKF
jgi:hypothetical protein